MDKYIFDESNSLWYELIGDYYFPCLTIPVEEKQPVGIWGQRHKRYLKKHHSALYNALLLSGKLTAYLLDIDETANEWMDRLLPQMMKAAGVTEELKARNQMAWVGLVNNCRARAEEMILSDLIYV